MSASIFIETKSYYDEIVEKYAMNPTLSIEEMKDDFSMITPTGNPIADICFLRIVGDYICKNMIHQQWSASPYIINEVYCMLWETFPNLHFSMNEFGSSIIEQQNKGKSPSMIDLMVLDFMDPYLKVYHNCRDTFVNKNTELYFNDRQKLRTNLKEIIEKYKMTWDEIDNAFEELSDMVTNPFDDMESDPVYQAAFSIIDEIEDQAMMKIEPLITLTSEKMNSYSSIYGISLKDYQAAITEEFKTKMDIIYHDIIVTKNFNNTIYNIVSNLFDTEKKKNLLFLSMSSLTVALSSMNSA
jgi:hypothetical protein